jgi:hypothetical protein
VLSDAIRGNGLEPTVKPRQMVTDLPFYGFRFGKQLAP